jgi:Carboxypeptidase regulatory-like domain
MLILTLALVLTGGGGLMQYQRPTCAVSAQNSRVPRAVTGQIVDVTGAVIPNAEVLVRAANRNFSYTHTDGAGCFFIAAPLSPAEIHARAQGFRSTSQPIPVSTNLETRPILFHLEPGSGSYVEVMNETQAALVNYSYTVCVTDLSGHPVQATLVLQSKPETPLKPLLTDVWGCALVVAPNPQPILHVTAEGFQALDAPLPKSTTPYPPVKLTLQPVHPQS